MSRLLMWLALVFLVLFAVRSKLRELQGRNQRGAAGDAPGPRAGTGTGADVGAGGAGTGAATGWRARAAQRAADEAETMLCCAHCGIYYPASETVALNGRDYCSAAHAGLPPASA